MASRTAPTVLVVMGVSGVGKSTIAGLLAARLGWRLEEGDDLHPAANIAKMAAGEPLTDADRWPWLDRVGAWISARVDAAEPGVVTCSALRRAYRDRLRARGVAFVHLASERDEIAGRLTRRIDHFMPESLLGSQFATLEPLEPDERGIVVAVASRAPDEIVDEVVRRLELTSD